MNKKPAIAGFKNYQTDSYLMRYKTVKYWPVLESERITSRFGPRGSGFHNGLDIGGSTPGVAGDTIVAFYEGTVARSGWSSSYGWVVYIHTVPSFRISTRNGKGNSKSISFMYESRTRAT
jgi:murein DD-endopeptidase MepM/ murein hydrolase activator NlpD